MVGNAIISRWVLQKKKKQTNKQKTKKQKKPHTITLMSCRTISLSYSFGMSEC